MKPKIVASSLISALCFTSLAWAATEVQENLMRSIDAIGNAPLVAQAGPAVTVTPDEMADMDPSLAGPDAPLNEPAPAPSEPEPPLPDIDDLLGEPAPVPAPEPEVAVPDVADLLGESAPAPEPAPADIFAEEMEPAPVAVETPEEPAPVEAPAQDAMTDDAGGGEQLDEMEVVRRKAEEIEGLKKLQEANALLTRGDYEKAEQMFEEVRLPERAATDAAREEALWGMAEAAYRRALELYGQISYTREDLSASQKAVTDAEAKLSKALRDEAGHGEAARKLLGRVQAAGARLAVLSGRPVPPKYREDHVNKVRTNQELLDEGRKFYELEDYDKAEANFTQILSNNPYHRDAMRFLRRIEEKRLSTSNLRRRATRADMISDISDRWNPPIRTTTDAALLRPQERPTTTGAGSTRLLEKMQSTVIPSIEFRKAKIEDVITFLREASEEQDPTKQGVNIILKLGDGTATDTSAPAMDLTPAPATEFGGFDDFGMGGAATQPQVTAPAPVQDTITLTLRRVTLLDAIRYVTDVANLKYRVEDNAVIITPRDAVDNVVTRLYPVQPTILELTRRPPEDTGVTEQRGGGDFISMDSGLGTLQATSDMKKFFSDMGVPFPADTSIAYNQQISQLIVRNTPENLEILERILQQLDVIPKQVEIEARFVDVSDSDLRELGMEWFLTDNWEIARQKNGLSLDNSQRIIMGSNNATGGFTRGLRFFGGTDTPNLVANTSAAASSSFLGGLFTLSSVLTNPEVSMVVHALEQKGALDVLSSPRVTTKNSVAATIKVIEEIIYPTEYESQQVGDQNIVPVQVDPNNPNLQQPVLERPPVPQTFETREVGVILDVTPIVGSDGQTIDLTLAPEVTEFARWIDYGPNGLYPILMPVFASRKVNTSVTLWDGQTIVMGGLIREQTQKVNDRIPLLGDIPLLGRLFRNEGEFSNKQNLMIFLSARIVDPAGNPIRRGGTAIGSGSPEAVGVSTSP